MILISLFGLIVPFQLHAPIGRLAKRWQAGFGMVFGNRFQQTHRIGKCPACRIDRCQTKQGFDILGVNQQDATKHFGCLIELIVFGELFELGHFARPIKWRRFGVLARLRWIRGWFGSDGVGRRAVG